MDPVSHAALGAACAQAALFKWDKYKITWIVGALAGMAPDLDVFIRSASDPMLLLIYHRQFTHSLSFIPIGGLFVALCLCVIKRFRLQLILTIVAALIGYGTHGLLDACTNYGTVLYWPFSHERISWDVIAIVDPRFTIPLILGVIWTTVFVSRKGVLCGLGVAGALMTVNIWQQHRVLAIVEQYAQLHHWTLNKRHAFPDIASTSWWRAIALVNHQQVFVANVRVPIFGKPVIDAPEMFPLFKAVHLPPYVAHTGEQLRDYRVFNWFTDGYLIEARKNPLILVDGRFLVGYKPMIALWGIQFVPQQNHVNKIRFLTLEY